MKHSWTCASTVWSIGMSLTFEKLKPLLVLSARNRSPFQDQKNGIKIEVWNIYPPGDFTLNNQPRIYINNTDSFFSYTQLRFRSLWSWNVTLDCLFWGSRDGSVVRALASHKCVPGSIHAPGVICGLNLLLVLSLLREVFLRVLRFSPLLKKQHFSNSNSILECTNISERVLWTPWYSVGKQITFTLTYKWHLHFFYDKIHVIGRRNNLTFRNDFHCSGLQE